MTRIKRGVTAHQRHQKLLKQTRGMTHMRRASSRLARQAVTKSLQYAYRDRRNKKRVLRALWISRINAGARQSGISYGQLAAGLKKANIELDRKILAELTVNHPHAFRAIVDTVLKAN
ncbi:50S ribosomal protein L20 [Candidatus Microgenomates bacterium]|nr:50S ribosomal protein L20 [Candidatus Microgenomates bacterium]